MSSLITYIISTCSTSPFWSSRIAHIIIFYIYTVSSEYLCSHDIRKVYESWYRNECKEPEYVVWQPCTIKWLSIIQYKGIFTRRSHITRLVPPLYLVLVLYTVNLQRTHLVYWIFLIWLLSWELGCNQLATGYIIIRYIWCCICREYV